MTRKLLAKVGLGLVLLVAALAAPSQAGAAVGCYGDYCSGRDPSSTGCSADGITVAAKDVAGGRLELRWSPRCKTNWTRWQQYPPRIGTPVPMQIRAVQDTGYTQRRNVAGSTGAVRPGTYWTPMIYSPSRKVRAEAAMTCFGVGDCAVSALTGNPVRTVWR